MADSETFKVPSYILNHLKSQIDKFSKESPKPLGFSQIQGIYSLGYITESQLNKLSTFFENYQPSDAEQKEKWEVYGGNIIRSYVKNTLMSLKTKKSSSNLIRRLTKHPTGASSGNQSGREVDRYSKVSKTSTVPPKITGNNITKQLMMSEDVLRMFEITNYINKKHGLNSINS